MNYRNAPDVKDAAREAWEGKAGLRSATPIRAIHGALWVGLLVLCVYLLTGSSDLKHNGDTLLRYQSTQSIVEQHHLWIDHPVTLGTRLAEGLGNHLYVSAYGPGQIIFMVPFYILGSVLAHSFHLHTDIVTLYAARSLDLVLGALLAALFYMMAVSIGYSRRIALVLTLLFAFASPAWPDAQSAMEHTQVSLFLLLSVFAAWRFTQGGLTDRRWLVLCGAASGLDVFARYDAAIYIPLVLLLPLYTRSRQRSLVAVPGDWLTWLVGFAPWVLFLMLWNQLRFGSPFNVALHLRTFGEPPLEGFSGLVFSPGKGILWYLPLVFLLPWAARSLYRRLPALTVLFAALVVTGIVFYSTVLYWHGDPAWGPRYLYPLLPYLVLALAEILRRWSGHRVTFKAFFIVLAALSLAIQVAAVSVTQWRYWYHLEVIQEHTAQKFNWGPTAYTYYWDVTRSPLLYQLRDVYEVLRLDVTGDRGYRLTKRPTVCTLPTRCLDNPANNYPINTLVFWWADTRHPVLDERATALLALLLLAGIGVAGFVCICEVRSGEPPFILEIAP